MAAMSLNDVIAAQNVKFMKAFDDGDLTALSQLYTEDCKLMPSGTDVQVGREGVINVFGNARKSGVASVILEIDETGPFSDTSADCVYERSKYTFKDADGKIVDRGKYVVIWKKVDGVYHLYIDIFNTSQ